MNRLAGQLAQVALFSRGHYTRLATTSVMSSACGAPAANSAQRLGDRLHNGHGGFPAMARQYFDEALFAEFLPGGVIGFGHAVA